MMTLTIWWCGIFLESLVLFRGLRAKLFSKYPFFYTYIASLLLADTSLYFVFLLHPASYEKWNWATGFLNLILGCGVLLEIFKHVLSPYAGAARFARIAGMGIFAAVFAFVILQPMMSESSRAAFTNVEAQRNFVTAEAILLFGILGVVSYYGISMGRNLKGMVCGYGLCLATSLMALALRSYVGPKFYHVWSFMQPFSYLVSMFIWMATLWSYRPNLAPAAPTVAEEDYEALAARTRESMAAMRVHLIKTARS